MSRNRIWPSCDLEKSSTTPPGPGLPILLLLEVSDSSLRYDKRVKAILYAEMGIAEYWIIDVDQDTLIAYSEPSAGSFRKVHGYHRGDVITPLLVPMGEIDVASLLP